MAGKPQKNSVPSIAARLSEAMGFAITPKMVRLWTAAGHPLDDLPALRLALKNQERQPKGFKEAEAKREAAEAKTKKKPPGKHGGEKLSAETVEQELANLQRDLLASPDYEKARTINTKITGMKTILRELREQRHYIPITESAAAGAKAAVESKARWEALEDDLPPRLEGLTAAQMKKELREYGKLKCQELAEIFEKTKG